MIELFDKVLLPYIRNEKWLLIAVVFEGQWIDKVKCLIEKCHQK